LRENPELSNDAGTMLKEAAILSKVTTGGRDRTKLQFSTKIIGIGRHSPLFVC
jgi:hypothetical protein